MTYFGNISLQKVATGTKYDVINDMKPSHFEIDWCKVFFNLFGAKALKKLLRWLDWIFLGGYLPNLSINYIAMSKDMGKRLPQLYYIKMKISYDLGFIVIGVTMAT